jgi:multiple sugar transport system permease protein
MIETIRLAFFDTPPTGEQRFVGLENFTELFQDDLFWLVARNTVSWTIGSTIFSFLIGLGAALLVHTRVPGSRIISGILVIPYVIGQVTAAYAWRWMLHSDFGVISQTLMQFGLLRRPILFLSSADLVMASLVLVNTWKSFPFVMIMMLAGLQTIPEELYRAAKVDGANAWQQFWEITLPQLVPVITVTTVLSIIGNMNSFTIPYVMTGGGPAHQSEIVITWVNNLSFQSLRFGYASAVAVVLFIVLFVFSFFYVRALINRGGSGQTL